MNETRVNLSEMEYLSELQHVHILSFTLTFQYREIEMVFIKADGLHMRKKKFVMGKLLSWAAQVELGAGRDDGRTMKAQTTTSL